MSNVYQLPTHTDPTEEACEWLARVDRGLNRDEAAALRAWLQAREANLAAYEEAAQLWGGMDALSQLAALFPERETKQRQPRAWWAVAATVMIAGLTALWMLVGYQLGARDRVPAVASTPTPVIAERRYATAIGGADRVILSDGSVLTLNTDTLVTERFFCRSARAGAGAR